MADLTPVVLTSISPLSAPAPSYVGYLVDPALTTTGSKSISMDTLFGIITRNITDKALRWEGSASTPGVSSGGGSIYFDSTSGQTCFKASENGLAYDALMLLNKAQTATNKSFTNPVLNNPTINANGFANALHNHHNAATGGLVDLVAVDLTDGPLIATNAAAGQYFRITLTASGHQLDIPSNAVDTMMRIWEIKQGGTGTNLISLVTTGAGSFAFGSDVTSITASTTVGAIDILTCVYNASKSRWLVLNFTKGF